MAGGAGPLPKVGDDMSDFPLQKMQAAIADEGFDGWLFYDFHKMDPIAHRILRMPPDKFLTRRWFYYVPKAGAPQKLQHKIEPASLGHLPGEGRHFASWKELESGLAAILKGARTIAMNYSPRNAIPYVSHVDGGTLELVRETGVKVVSSADLVQLFEAVWSESQLQSHIRAAKALRSIVDETFAFTAKRIRDGKALTEYDVQQFMVERFAANGMHSDNDPPIAAVNGNAGNPHYGPSKDVHAPVRKGDFLLIDLWAREKDPDAVYADITWTGFIGETVPDKHEEIFRIVAGGRDAALRLVEDSFRQKKVLYGAQVDDAARDYITKKGYGEYFIHRTGHNIGWAVHGNGAHMDNFETHEERKVLPGTCFSIEPGIYMKEFGVRSEIDVYVGRDDVHVYGGPIQTAVVPILKL
jgi:Xaa-Pro aminopeptidase